MMPFLRHHAGTLLATIAATLVLAGAMHVASAGKAPGRTRQIALFINGTLGDKSFFDGAALGLAAAHRNLAVPTRVIEGGYDPIAWEAALTELADSGEYGLIVAGTHTMVPLIERLAGAYPEQDWVVFDASVDYQNCRCERVHSILFRQNEAAYLAGIVAGKLPAGPAGLVGIVGGMRIPVVQDFAVGFQAGLAAAAPQRQVLTQYINSFSNPAAAKEIASAMYARGADLVFHIDGAAGQGVIEAAAGAARWSIGVDLDQYSLYKEAHPAWAAHILTSVVKRVDLALGAAIGQWHAGRLAGGRASTFGLDSGAVGLVWHPAQWDGLPAHARSAVEQAQSDISAGRIVVPSAFAQAVAGRQ